MILLPSWETKTSMPRKSVATASPGTRPYPGGVVIRHWIAPPGESRSVPTSVTFPAATARLSARAQPRSGCRTGTVYLPPSRTGRSRCHQKSFLELQRRLLPFGNHVDARIPIPIAMHRGCRRAKPD